MSTGHHGRRPRAAGAAALGGQLAALAKEVRRLRREQAKEDVARMLERARARGRLLPAEARARGESSLYAAGLRDPGWLAGHLRGRAKRERPSPGEPLSVERRKIAAAMRVGLSPEQLRVFEALERQRRRGGRRGGGR